jgi:O-acetyl-ADP-ribose deacetylase (regulator of RNase III)
MTRMRKIPGDITRVRADVVVNAANTELEHGGGVARAIARAAGEDLERESRAAGFVPLGSFAATTAGDLDAEVVLHIPTIDYTARGGRIGYDQLEATWRQALAWCRNHGHTSIATPLLGAGVVGLEPDRVEEILGRVSGEFPELEVTLVVR